MDPVRFDRLAKSLSSPETRRRVFGVLAAVPVVGGLLGILSPEETDAAGRRKRRKTRNKRRSGDDKKHRKGKHKKKKQPTCTPTTCAAEGKSCGRLPDGCGTTLDCGPCTCATGCHPDCQTCNPATGLCDDVANDTSCDDGDACTEADTCQDGTCVAGTPVVCTTPPGPCYQATGTCEPDGTCLYAFKPSGAACTDGDACTQPDACDGAGACIAGAPVTCPALNQCYEQGICNTSTGVCTTPKKADGTPCDDGDACTINEVCTDGVCGGGSPKCGGGQRCVGGACVCDATSCPTGCCDAQGQCQVGTEAGACGSIGGTCIDCGTGGICEAGQCRCGTCSGPTPYCSRTNTCVTCQAWCSPCQCLTLSDGTQTCSSGQRFSCPQPGCTSNGQCGGGLECVNAPLCGPRPPAGQGYCAQVSRGNCPA
jgi:hypothetical protein